LNTHFQGKVRRVKKAFLSNQCKEIEENNEMGKTTELFRKIRDTKDSPKALSEDQGVACKIQEMPKISRKPQEARKEAWNRFCVLLNLLFNSGNSNQGSVTT